MNPEESVWERNQAATSGTRFSQAAGGIFTCSQEFDLHNGRA